MRNFKENVLQDKGKILFERGSWCTKGKIISINNINFDDLESWAHEKNVDSHADSKTKLW